MSRLTTITESIRDEMAVLATDSYIISFLDTEGIGEHPFVMWEVSDKLNEKEELEELTKHLKSIAGVMKKAFDLDTKDIVNIIANSD